MTGSRMRPVLAGWLTAALPAACTFDPSAVGSSSNAQPDATETATGTDAPLTGSGSDSTSDQGTGNATSHAGTTTSEPADTAPADGSTTAGCTPQPWYPDADGDDFGDPAGETVACDPPPDHVGNADDCDDANPTISPAVDELCNDRDDDCDGITDEGSAQNLACDGCGFLLAADGSRWFAVCGGANTWADALTACQTAFGPTTQLGRIDDPVDQANLLALIAGTDHWLSLNDLAREGLWVWHDGSVAHMGGTPVGYNGWRPDQPVFGDASRCGELDVAGWADAECDQPQARICEHPP